MVTYVATLDVPRHTVEFLARLLAAHRRRLRTPRGSRALGPFRQAVLVLRWFRECGCVHCLARALGFRRPRVTATYTCDTKSHELSGIHRNGGSMLSKV